MVELQKNVGKFEKLIRDKDGQLAALQEQVDEAVKTIAAQKTVIDRLRVSTAV
jgi:peptidoglycan hydrolase CwlO-like protein